MTDEDIERRLTAVDARCKSNQHRLDDVDRRQKLAPIEFGGTMEKV